MKEKQETKSKQQIRVPQLAVSKRFGQYKKEEKQPVREPDSKKIDEKKVEQLIEICKKIRYTPHTDLEINEIYPLMLAALRNLHYTEYEVAAFCSKFTQQVANDQTLAKSGLFISALINKSTGRKFLINTQDMQHRAHILFLSTSIGINYLGYRNSKRITIIGDVGDDLGSGMQKGEIHVLGNAGNYVGFDLKGGRIIIEGNAGENVGYAMSGGEIHVNGEMGEVDESSIFGGKIFHKGILIAGDDS